MSSNRDPKFSWSRVVSALKWVATIVVLGLSGGGGIAMVNAFIAFGEIRNEVKQQGETLASLDQRLTSFGMSQARMEGNMEMIVRFIVKGDKDEDSASLVEEESAENIPAGMSM